MDHKFIRAEGSAMPVVPAHGENSENRSFAEMQVAETLALLAAGNLVAHPSKEGQQLVEDGKPKWMHEARCREFEATIFFPSDSVGVRRAAKICAECSVRLECLEYALSEPYELGHGVWGGTSERERRKILRERRVAS